MTELFFKTSLNNQPYSKYVYAQKKCASFESAFFWTPDLTRCSESFLAWRIICSTWNHIPWYRKSLYPTALQCCTCLPMADATSPWSDLQIQECEVILYGEYGDHKSRGFKSLTLFTLILFFHTFSNIQTSHLWSHWVSLHGSPVAPASGGWAGLLGPLGLQSLNGRETNHARNNKECKECTLHISKLRITLNQY